MGEQDLQKQIEWWVKERKRAIAFGDRVFSEPWSEKHDRLLRGLLRDLVRTRRLWRRFLASRFDYDVRRPRRMPRAVQECDAYDWDVFRAAFRNYHFPDALLGVCKRIRVQLSPQRALGVLLDPRSTELWNAMHAHLDPPDLRERAILQLIAGGYCGTSLSKAGRLSRKLTREHGGGHSGLLAELPGTVAALVGSGRFEDALFNVSGAIDKDLKRVEDSRLYVDTGGRGEGDAFAPSAEAEFEAKERAAQMEAEAKARLSPREWEVFRLTCDEWTGPEIAAALRMTPSTVNVQQFRIREKLRSPWGVPPRPD